jgi:glycosidase
LGFTHIWLMGVWTTGPRARAISLRDPDLRAEGHRLLPDFNEEDIAGSPYAISEYTVSPSLGGEMALKAFRQRLAEAGLKLVLDFVPNHVGLDHPWVVEHPGFFVSCDNEAEGTFLQMTAKGPYRLAHGRDPFFPPWVDTVQLDYRQAATRAAMLKELKRVAAQCDGVRCDMAMLVLNEVFAQTWRRFPALCPQPTAEFWSEAIAAVRAEQPGFLFIAETYWDLQEPLQALGFDFTYYKELYDAVVRREFDWLQRRLHQPGPPFLRRCVHFLENHDEPRIASLLSSGEQRAAAVLLLSLPGMRLLHEGQLAGARRPVPVHLRRRPADRDPDIAAFYERLLQALRGTGVGCGTVELLRPFLGPNETAASTGVVGVQWQAKPDAFDLALVNLNPMPAKGRVLMKVEGLGARRWKKMDVLAVASEDHSGAELERHGLAFALAGHSAALWRFLAC